MRILVVLDHPYTVDSADNVPHRRSFTAAVTEAAIRGARSAGHEVDLIDLSADGFDPRMSADDLTEWRLRTQSDPQVLDYQRRVLEAEQLVFAFPIWWEAMPAATKGFLDRVLAEGVLYEELEGAKGNPFRSLMPRLNGVTLLTVMTTPTAAYRWWFGDPVTKVMFKGAFGKIGVKNLRWRNYDRVEHRTPLQRQRMIDATEQYFSRLSVAKPPKRAGATASLS
ncbi:NAD(P)H-dependent oxidoreductase [Humibacter sp. RRB41]|uniref:NAD(P)H-dependent oxidoreductase n=1 Tax=Humibacter sp. RRB41 TaxID=2919946 RepID=UPI001FAA9225|nr:NAD(P)H-dependent oxidoreductase [Humibacter sp. RRB41]